MPLNSIDVLPAGPIQLIPRPAFYVLARTVLVWFLTTFLVSRGVVLLIMLRLIPDMFFFVGQAHTHVHHLNYGIFLLSFVGGFLLFVGPEKRTLAMCAALYGIAMALTFDEFGMWLHLGGSYWQAGSYDAIVVITALLLLLAFMPRLRHFRTRHWFITMAVVGGSIGFACLFLWSVLKLGNHFGPRLIQIEQQGPST